MQEDLGMLVSWWKIRPAEDKVKELQTWFYPWMVWTSGLCFSAPPQCRGRCPDSQTVPPSATPVLPFPTQFWVLHKAAPLGPSEMVRPQGSQSKGQVRLKLSRLFLAVVDCCQVYLLKYLKCNFELPELYLTISSLCSFIYIYSTTFQRQILDFFLYCSNLTASYVSDGDLTW